PSVSKGVDLMRSRGLSYSIGFLLLLSLVPGRTALAQSRTAQRDLGPDQPGDEEELNRELWEYAKKTPYNRALSYVARAQQAARSKANASVALPNGWKIAPAGTQVELGRFPGEAVVYAGRVVVLNTGYYVAQGQEVSIVDPDLGQVVRTLRLP